MGWNREVPQFAPRISHSVPPSVPRRSNQVHMIVASLIVVAFTYFAKVRQPLFHAGRFSRGRVTRLQSSLYVTARSVVSPSPARTFTAELSPNESPQLDVDYNYAGKQSIPATGLSPVRYAALWAANELARIMKNIHIFLLLE